MKWPLLKSVFEFYPMHWMFSNDVFYCNCYGRIDQNWIFKKELPMELFTDSDNWYIFQNSKVFSEKLFVAKWSFAKVLQKQVSWLLIFRWQKKINIFFYRYCSLFCIIKSWKPWLMDPAYIQFRLLSNGFPFPFEKKR